MKPVSPRCEFKSQLSQHFSVDFGSVRLSRKVSLYKSLVGVIRFNKVNNLTITKDKICRISWHVKGSFKIVMKDVEISGVLGVRTIKKILCYRTCVEFFCLLKTIDGLQDNPNETVLDLSGQELSKEQIKLGLRRVLATRPINLEMTSLADNL